MNMATRDADIDRTLHALVTRLDPPPGPLPDPESLVALVEGRLLPDERARVLEAVRESPAARAELRALFPDAWRELLGAEPEGAVVIPGPWRRAAPWLAGVVTAAAAALALSLRPPGPPADSALTVLPDPGVAERTRGAEAEAIYAAPGERIDVLMRLGRPSGLDALTRAEPWGALFLVDRRGRARLVCTSADARCRASADTMAWLFTAPREPGPTRFFFLVANRPVPDAALTAATADLDAPDPDAAAAEVERRLHRVAAEHGGRVHAHLPVIVRAP